MVLLNSPIPYVLLSLSPTASLRMMHLDNEEKWRDPSKFAGVPPVMANPQVAPPAAPAMPQQAALMSPVASNQPSSQDQQYARGSSLMRILGDGMVLSLSDALQILVGPSKWVSWGLPAVSFSVLRRCTSSTVSFVGQLDCV